MLNKIKKNNSGFTIIEVLIVLAIAGLILLVVFLAVPALQRNQRNQSYRSEANRLVGALQEITANNGGTNLTASACGTPAVVGGTAAPLCTAVPSTTGASATAANAQKVYQAANLKTITALTIIVPASPSAATAATPLAGLTAATIAIGVKCDNTATPDFTKYVAGTPRQSASFFAVEDTRGLVVAQCIES